MSDFSLFSLFTAGLACVVPLVSAYTQPVGDSPSGNPIYQPGLNSIVPAGENFTVTWDPTTPGTVTLVLLKGPSTNAVPQYAIAEKIDNSGSYVWTPATDLEPQDTGYGLQLIVDATGQYQYTTQFGISNPNYKAGSTTSSSSSSASASTTGSWSGHGGHGGPGGYGTWSSDWATTTVSASASATASANSTSAVNGTTSTRNTITAYPTGSAPSNSSIVRPTGNVTIPSSLLTTTATATGYSSSVSAVTATGSSTSASALPTNAAGAMATSFAGLVVAAGVAVFAL